MGNGLSVVVALSPSAAGPSPFQRQIVAPRGPGDGLTRGTL